MATQTKTTDAGPVGLIPMGDYNPSATYSLLMTVLYNHDSWVCIAMTADGDEKDIIGIAPDDPTYGAQNWQALTDGGRAAVAAGNQVRADFDQWFGATENAGIRRTVSDWFAQVQAEWTAWFSDTLVTGVRKLWNDWFGGVQTDWSGLRSDATTATNRANTAAGISEEMNAHPPFIGDGTTGDLNFWYLWSHSLQQYVKGPYSKGDDLHWEDMTQEEKDDLAHVVLDNLVFATDADCIAAAAEISFIGE